jgi:hypothetical protein
MNPDHVMTRVSTIDAGTQSILMAMVKSSHQLQGTHTASLAQRSADLTQNLDGRFC